MFISQIQSRRSIRKYQEKPVETEKIDTVIEAMLRSPSSRNGRPWEFVVVTDKNLLQKLAAAKKHASSFLKGAPLAVVVCAEPKTDDTWIEDSSIASIIGQLAAESLGLGSCWIQIRNRPHNDNQSAEAYVAELLEIPEHLKIESIMAIGYPAEQKPPHEKDELLYDRIKLNNYNRLYQ